MKRFAKCVCIILSLAMLLAVPAYATEALNTRASSFFMKSSVYLYETSGTTFQAWFDVTGMRIMDKIGAKEIKIQRSSDNENWSTMRTYSMTDYSSLICENTSTHSACVTYTGTSGYYYRAYITLYAKDSTGTGTWTRYTSSIYID